MYKIRLFVPYNITLNSLFQEKLKWQKQQEEFNRRKRDHEMHLVEIERKEVQRREEEIRQKKELLGDKRRRHDQIQNDIIEQVCDLLYLVGTSNQLKVNLNCFMILMICVTLFTETNFN